MRADGARPGHFVVVMCRDRLAMSTVVSTIFIGDDSRSGNSTTGCSLGSLGSDGITAITTATATVTVTAAPTNNTTTRQAGAGAVRR